jgi:hypothetical protein
MIVGNNNLTASAQYANGNSNSQASVVYNATNHRWWQIRETGGVVSFEAGPDGVAWTKIHSISSSVLPDVIAARVQLTAGAPGMSSMNPTIQWDNLNNNNKTESFCKATSLTDDFKDSSKLAHWKDAFVAPGCKRTISGDIVFEYDGNMASGCSMDSSHAFDLTGSHVSIRLIEASYSPSNQFLGAGLMVRRDRDNNLRIRRTGDTLRTEKYEDNLQTASTSQPFDKNNHKWLRIRESGGKVYFETSADGTNFAEISNTTFKYPLTEMDVLFGPDNVQSGTKGTIKLDDYNKP